MIKQIREYIADRRHAKKAYDRLSKHNRTYEAFLAEREITHYRQLRKIKILRIALDKALEESATLKEQFLGQANEIGALRKYKKEESERLVLLNKRIKMKYGFEVNWENLSAGNLK